MATNLQQIRQVFLAICSGALPFCWMKLQTSNEAFFDIRVMLCTKCEIETFLLNYISENDRYHGGEYFEAVKDIVVFLYGATWI